MYESVQIPSQGPSNIHRRLHTADDIHYISLKFYGTQTPKQIQVDYKCERWEVDRLDISFTYPAVSVYCWYLTVIMAML